MKKKVIALVIATTLIGGVGVTAYASVGPNVNKKTYLADYRVNKNENQLLGEMKKQGLIKYTYLGGFEDVKNNCVKNVQRILSGNNVIDSTASNDDSNTSKDNSEVIKAPQDTNNQENDGNLQEEQNKVDTNNPEVKVPETVEQAPNTDTSKANIKTPEVVEQAPKTDTSKENTPEVAQTPTTIVSDSFMAKVEQLIYQRVNVEREKAGVATLTYSSTMEKYARYKSQDMGDKGYFDHQDPQGNLITVKMENEGVSYNAWGENIAYIGGVSDEAALATQFMDNWMNSPGHKANILSVNFSSIGVGVYKIGNKVDATQEFYK